MTTTETTETSTPDPAPRAEGAAKPGSEDERDEKDPKQSEIVIQIVEAEAGLFHDVKGTGFAAIELGERQEAVRLRSKRFRQWCAFTVRERRGYPVGQGSIEEALVVLEGIATCNRPEERTHIRVAEEGGALWLDLADPKGHAVRITRAGWAVETTAPVRFVRPNAMRALPMPVRGVGVDALRPFLNVAHEDGFTLALAWLVTAFRPGKPFPVLNLTGEQGKGKSTASRVLRSLVDPNAAPIRSAPRAEDDLFVAAVNAHVIAYDNLSGIPPWLSDGLCRLATGGAMTKRELYTDGEEVVLEAIRPLIVNGIDDLAARSDLADRSLLVGLEPIAPDARRDEARFGDLSRLVGEDAKRAKGWPKQPNHLSGQLNRARTFLREIGIAVGERSEGRGPTRRRFIVLSSAASRPGVQNDRPHRPHDDKSANGKRGNVVYGIAPASPPHRPPTGPLAEGADRGPGRQSIIDNENANDSHDGVDGVDGADESATSEREAREHAFADLLGETGS